jgi:hypothetical protein
MQLQDRNISTGSPQLGKTAQQKLVGPLWDL